MNILFTRARMHRLSLRNTIFIGITGSAGKTTTKELVVSILSRLYQCHSSMLTRNMQSHVAETVLSTQRKHRFAVVEMSGGQPGELDSGIRNTRPKIAALTIIGRDHYSAFKSIEAIAAEKGKLISSLPADGTAILNIDDPLIRKIGDSCKCHVIWVGTEDGANIRLLEASSLWPEPLKLAVEYEGKKYTVKTQLHGTHLAQPILTAIGIAVAAEVPFIQAIQLLGEAKATIGRMQIVGDGKGVHFARDDFKAPEWTLSAPIDFIGAAQARRKAVVIGTISDSPLSPRKRYQRAANKARQVADLALFIGRDAHHALRAKTSPDDESIQAFATVREAARYLDDVLRSGDLVLLKGTNKSDHLGRVLLNRKKPIQCWEDNCRLDIFCESCTQLFQNSPSNDSADVGNHGEQENAEGAQHLQLTPLGNNNLIRVVIGLGNKGIDKQWTRHNIGFRVIEYLSKMLGGVWDTIAEGKVSLVALPDGTQIVLFKPSSAMNKIGIPVKRFLNNQGISAGNCMVVHDDMDLEFGSLRAKVNGGDGGHNGLRSIIGALGTSQFHRLRIGVRTPDDKGEARQTILKEFSHDQELEMDRILQQASEKIQDMIHSEAISSRSNGYGNLLSK